MTENLESLLGKTVIDLLVQLQQSSIFKRRSAKKECYDKLRGLFFQSVDLCVKNEHIAQQQNIHFDQYLNRLNQDILGHYPSKIIDVDEAIYQDFFYRVFREPFCAPLVTYLQTKEGYSEIAKCLDQAQRNHEHYMDIYYKDRLSPIESMSCFVRNYNTLDSAFVTGANRKLAHVLELLKNPQTSKLYILAMSGMGKSRWVYESFSHASSDDAIFYCNDVRNQNFSSALKRLIDDYRDKECLLVLDDCPYGIYQESLRSVEQSKANIRLYGLYNDLNDDPSINDKSSIVFDYQDLEDITEIMITDGVSKCAELSEYDREQYIKDYIKYAEGIPYMANFLTQSILEDQNLNDKIVSDNIILLRILKFKDGYNEDKIKVAETLALFQPLQYTGEVEDDYKFVMENSDLTPLLSSGIDRNLLFKEVIADLKQRQIIEQRSSWINIRPRPIAMVLVSEWFRHCDSVRLKHLFDSLQSLSNDHEHRYISQRLILGWCNRINYLQCSDSTVALISEMTGRGGYFDNKEIICSNLTLLLFRSMAMVHPMAIVDCLYRNLYSTDICWLKEHITDDIKNHIGWIFEKLCFCKSTFHKAIALVAKLALTETSEGYFTQTFYRIFHIYLSGTEVDLDTRFAVIEGLHAKGKTYDKLLLLAIDHALRFQSFGRSGGIENFGYHKLVDYEPNEREIFNYWNHCKSLLLQWMDEDVSVVDEVAKMVETHAYNWCACGDTVYIASELISKVIAKRGTVWNQMLEKLKDIKHSLFKHYPEAYRQVINQLIEQLSQNDFISRLSYAQYDYRYVEMSFEEKYGPFSIQYYQPFVEEFVAKKYYQDNEIVRCLLMMTENAPHLFARVAGSMMGDGEVNDFLTSALNVIRKQQKDWKSFVLCNYCTNIKNKEVPRWFLDALSQEGYMHLYIDISTWISYGDLSLLKELISRKDIDAIAYYTKNVNYKNSSHLCEMCSLLAASFPNDYGKLLIPLLSNSQCDLGGSNEVLNLVLQGVLSYCRKEDKYSDQALEVVNILLKKYDVNDFAKALHLILVERSFSYNLFNRYKLSNIVKCLFTKYRDVVVDDFIDAIINSEKKIGYAMRNAIEGILSDVNSEDDPIVQKCLQYADTDVAAYMVSMYPKFYIDKEHGIVRFSNFMVCMLNHISEFSNPQRVLDHISSRVAGFTIVANSLVGVYEQQKRCYEWVLASDKYPLIVQEWANIHIRSLDSEICQEQNSNAYDEFNRE